MSIIQSKLIVYYSPNTYEIRRLFYLKKVYRFSNGSIDYQLITFEDNVASRVSYFISKSKILLASNILIKILAFLFYIKTNPNNKPS